jgi:hypothetical protein
MRTRSVKASAKLIKSIPRDGVRSVCMLSRHQILQTVSSDLFSCFSHWPVVTCERFRSNFLPVTTDPGMQIV